MLVRYYVQFITDNVGPPGECQYYRDRNKFSLQRKLYQEEERKQITRKYTEIEIHRTENKEPSL